MSQLENRIFGLDILRTLAFIAVICFHTHWFLTSQISEFPVQFPGPFWQMMEEYTRYFGFSGFLIVMISCFLIGWQHDKNLATKKKNIFLAIFLLIGWLIFSFILALREEGRFHLAWDIYPLFILGLSSSPILFSKHPFHLKSKIFLILALGMLLTPFWKWTGFQKLPLYLQEILIGRCPEDFADWPILPWIALMWVSFWYGKCYASVKTWRFHRGEIFLWPGVFVVFWMNKNAYFAAPFDDRWSCYLYRRPPLVFMSHALFWIFWIRLSCHPTMQLHLAKSAIMKRISSLASNKYFYWAYLLQYICIFSVEGILRGYQLHPMVWAWDLALLISLLAPEVLTRSLLTLNSLFKAYFFRP